MNRIFTIFFISFFFFGISQNRKFKTQGEQENYWAEQIFENEYQIQKYPKFKGKISKINNTKIIFDDKTLKLNIFEYYLPIFENGIFYPQLILGYEKNNEVLNKQELEKLTEQEEVFNEFGKNDLLKISNLEELTFLNKSPKIKRFRFWNFKPGMVNPQVYYFELTNKKANEKTTLSEFMKKAKLTFLKAGSLII